MARAVYPNQETRFPEPAAEPVYRPSAGVRNKSNLALHDAAETVGEAVGSAVTTVRDIPDRLQEMKRRFTVIRGRAREDLRNKAADLAGEIRQQARRTAEQARTRAEMLARQQPLAVIAGAAACGVLLGIALRLWRDHAE